MKMEMLAISGGMKADEEYEIIRLAEVTYMTLQLTRQPL
jgi:hypothetical protein